MKHDIKIFTFKCENKHTWDVPHFMEHGSWFPYEDEEVFCPECGEHYEDIVGSRKASKSDFFPNERD